LLLKNFDKLRSYHKVFLCDEGVGSAGATSSRRSSNSMHIVFNLIWNVVVNHILNVLDIKTATCYIGCDKHTACSSLSELFQDRFSFLLRLVTVYSLDSGVAFIAQVLDKFINTAFCLTEHDHLR